MKLSKPERQILYALGKFYEQLNQQLHESLQLETSKIAFIELLSLSKIITKQKRALYKNIESLEKKNLVEYKNRMIKFTSEGIVQLNRINYEIRQYDELKDYFSHANKPKRKLQTVIKS